MASQWRKIVAVLIWAWLTRILLPSCKIFGARRFTNPDRRVKAMGPVTWTQNLLPLRENIIKLQLNPFTILDNQNLPEFSAWVLQFISRYQPILWVVLPPASSSGSPSSSLLTDLQRCNRKEPLRKPTRCVWRGKSSFDVHDCNTRW